MYRMTPSRLLRLSPAEYHEVLVFAAAADWQNAQELREMTQHADKDDMGPGIAWAAFVAGKAAR